MSILLLTAALCLALLTLLWQSRRLDQAERHRRMSLAGGHALCLTMIQERLSAAHDADLLRRLADKWDTAEEQGTLRRLAHEQYTAGGPSMPTIWLRYQADQIEGPTS